MQPPDLTWIDSKLTASRPRVMAALLRYFRDLDLAEEAFQEACLRALKNWPDNGPPRNVEGWLITVGRNLTLDVLKHEARTSSLPPKTFCRTWRMPNRTWLNGSIRRTTVMTSCAFCLSAVIRICRLPSRSRLHCASYPAFRLVTSPGHFWSANTRCGSGSPVQRRR